MGIALGLYGSRVEGSFPFSVEGFNRVERTRLYELYIYIYVVS